MITIIYPIQPLNLVLKKINPIYQDDMMIRNGPVLITIQSLIGLQSFEITQFMNHQPPIQAVRSTSRPAASYRTVRWTPGGNQRRTSRSHRRSALGRADHLALYMLMSAWSGWDSSVCHQVLPGPWGSHLRSGRPIHLRMSTSPPRWGPWPLWHTPWAHILWSGATSPHLGWSTYRQSSPSWWQCKLGLRIRAHRWNWTVWWCRSPHRDWCRCHCLYVEPFFGWWVP